MLCSSALTSAELVSVAAPQALLYVCRSVQQELEQLRLELQTAGQASPAAATPKPCAGATACPGTLALGSPVAAAQLERRTPLGSSPIGTHTTLSRRGGGLPAEPLAASAGSALSHSAAASRAGDSAASPETVTGFAAPRPDTEGAPTPAAVAKAKSVRRGQLSEFLSGAIDRPLSPRLPAVDPPALSAGAGDSERGQSVPSGSVRAWGGTSVPPQPGASLAELFGRASLPRNDSVGRDLAPAAAGGKGAKVRGVKLSLAEFHAKQPQPQPQPQPETPAVERGSARSSGVAWGRSSGAGASAEAAPTPPSLSAIMSKEGIKRRGVGEVAKGVASGGTPQRRLVPERCSGGAAWQTADLSALRRAVIDEGLFEQAARLPDIRPNGGEGAWGRAQPRQQRHVTRIDDILNEQAARALAEQEDETAPAPDVGAATHGGVVASDVGGEGRRGGGAPGRGGPGARRGARGGRGGRLGKGGPPGSGKVQAGRGKDSSVTQGQAREKRRGGGEGGEGRRGAGRDGRGRKGGRRQSRGRGNGPAERPESGGRVPGCHTAATCEPRQNGVAAEDAGGGAAGAASAE